MDFEGIFINLSHDVFKYKYALLNNFFNYLFGRHPLADEFFRWLFVLKWKGFLAEGYTDDNKPPFS